MKTALIYKTVLLPISETFIQAQAGALKTFRGRFAGLYPASESLALPSDTILAVKDTSWPSRFEVQLYRLLGIAPDFFRRVRMANPSLIHSHFATDSVTVLPLARRLKLPLIVTLHGADVTIRDSILCDSLGGRLYLHRRRLLWTRASLFICVSEFIKRQAIEMGFPEEKLRVHYIGIDRSRFLPAPGRPKGDSILFVGRLTEKKGCKYLLQAMKLVQKKIPAAQLTIVGDGPLRASLQSLAGDLGVNCKFLGGQPSWVVKQLLESTRVFCVPSVTAENGDSEGLGMVFAEAQSTGVPVVSFQHGGIPEVVQHQKTGLLAPEFDYPILADHIQTYLTDDDLWKRSSVAGPDWIEQRFNIVKQTRVLEDIYSEVVADFRARKA
jgi:colanic acid/amylovoran biosynthesis glycosyltransferase